MKIKHVYGNVLKIDIPLTIKIRTIEDGTPSEREEPFYPDATKGCIVELANNYNRKIEYQATIKDNIAHIEDNGKISIGQYKVTVKCYDEEGNPYRYMVRDIVEICDATIDAGIEAGIEFNAETYTLEGAVFISYGGGSLEQVQADWNEEDETSKAYIQNKPALAEVATSGSYNDLSDKPEIDNPQRLFYPNETTAIDSETGLFQGSEFFKFRLRSGSQGWKILNSEWSENDQFPCKLSLQAAPDRELIRWDGFGGTDNSYTVFRLKAGFYGGDYIIRATAGNDHKISISDGLGHPILTSTMESVDFFLQSREKFFEIGRNGSGEYAHFMATTGLKFDRVYNKSEQKGTFYMGLKDRFVMYDNTDAVYTGINRDTDPEVRLVYNHSTGFKVYNNLLMKGYNLRGYADGTSDKSWEISAAGNFKLFTGSLTLSLGGVNIEQGSLVFGTLNEKGFVRFDANNAQFVLERTTMGPDGLVTIPADIAGYYTSIQIDALLRGKADKDELAAVATTGSYNDLKDKPNIPVVPTNVSAFNNDAGYINKSVNDLVNYYLKSEVYTKAEVANLIAAIQQFHYEIYASTSDVTSPQGNVLYLIGPTGTGSDRYEEYVYDSTKQEPWVKIGDTSIDLSDYYTKGQTDSAITSALNAALANYTTTAALTLLLAGKQDVINDLATIRSGAAAGATAYQKPQGGIPSTDMSQGVQESLSKANTALQQHQDISGKEDVTTIVTPVNETDATLPVTALTCEVGKYYRLDVPVETLAVTLPAITDNTTVRTVVLYLTTGTTPAVTISAADSKDVYYQDGFDIEAGKTYEVNALFNGSAWIIASVEIVVTNNGGE